MLHTPVIREVLGSARSRNLQEFKQMQLHLFEYMRTAAGGVCDKNVKYDSFATVWRMYFNLRLNQFLYLI